MVVFVIGCRSSDPRSLPREERQQIARKLYERDCAACHGVNGDGYGPQASRLATKPAAFTAGYFKFKSTGPGQPPLDEDLFRVISNGVPTTAMLPQAHLSDGERWVLVEYIKAFNRRGPGDFGRKPMEIGPAPPRTLASILRGRQLYREVGCSKCHGPNGEGDGPSADQLVDELGRKIRPRNLTYTPRKTGTRVEDVYRVVMTGLDGTPMPSFAEALSEEDAWALAQYVDSLAVNEYPAGMMGLIGEEVVGMQIDMRAARALMGRGMSRRMGRGGMMGGR